MIRRPYWYVLKGRTPVPVDREDLSDVEETKRLIAWGNWFADPSNRSLAWQYVTPKVVVSTVFLGIDHSYGRGEPVLFETIVFGGQFDNHIQGRYCTWDEAMDGHFRAIDRVSKSLHRRLRKRQHLVMAKRGLYFDQKLVGAMAFYSTHELIDLWDTPDARLHEVGITRTQLLRVLLPRLGLTMNAGVSEFMDAVNFAREAPHGPGSADVYAMLRPRGVDSSGGRDTLSENQP